MRIYMYYLYIYNAYNLIDTCSIMQHSKEKIEAALAHVSAGGSYRECKPLFGISHTTVMRHFNGRAKSNIIGRPPVLSATTEKFIANNLMY